MRRILAVITVIAMLSVAMIYNWSTSAPIAEELVIPTEPQNIEAAFAQREAIRADMLSDPRTWDDHLALAAAILEDQRRQFLAEKRWRLDTIVSENNQLIFRFITPEPNRMIAMPKYSDDSDRLSIEELFTTSAYRWICDRPETAAIWDLHHEMLIRDQDPVMYIAIFVPGGDALLELVVENQPCTTRSGLSGG